jgi:hypothetical protein
MARNVRLPRPRGERNCELLGAVVWMLTVGVADWVVLEGLKVQLDSEGRPVQL